jgi:predicted GIY-YIG superfamily endonuclease
MKKGTKAYEEIMQQRRERAERGLRRVLHKQVRRTDFSKQVGYISTDLRPIEQCSEVNGVYLLAENGQFYIGQAIRIQARFVSHQQNPVSCGFTNPRGVLLAELPYHLGWTWNMNCRKRLIAEARFIAAALELDIPLTNNRKIGTAFLRESADLSCEREILERAVMILR